MITLVQWVSVDDYMPEPHTLVVTNGGHPMCWDGENWTILSIPVGSTPSSSVTHWAALPQIPQASLWLECSDCRVLRKEVEELRAYKSEHEQLIV